MIISSITFSTMVLLTVVCAIITISGLYEHHSTINFIRLISGMGAIGIAFIIVIVCLLESLHSPIFP